MSSKQREVLEKCVRRLDAITPYLPLEFRKYVFADIQEAKAALAEPLKNYEVGTAEEQGERLLSQFDQWKRKYQGKKTIVAIMEWAHSTYEKGEINE